MRSNPFGRGKKNWRGETQLTLNRRGLGRKVRFGRRSKKKREKGS